MKQLWKLGAVTVVLVLLAGAALGIVAAQEEEPTATPDAAAEDEATATPGDEGDAAPVEKPRLRDRFFDNLAEQLGISREELDQAATDAALTMVDQLLAEDIITEEQAERLRQRIEEGEFPFFGRPHHPPHVGAYLGEELADFLGITTEELREARQGGQSLAQIAEANGVSRDDLIAFLVGQFEEKLADKVESEEIDQERADELLARFQERVEELVDRTEPFRPRFGPGPGRFQERFGPGFEVDPTSA